ncbi:MAG: hypothetical protein SGPRY_012173, partial [Prymnesium sp.]
GSEGSLDGRGGEGKEKKGGRLVLGVRPTVLLCVALASCFSFLLGYDIGVMSGAKREVAREMDLSTAELELLVGSLNIVSGFGGLLAGPLADRLGRKPTAALATLSALIGCLLMACAESFGPLLAGRVVSGVGVGGCFQLAPLYISEVSPRALRGMLLSSFDLFINLGILVGFLAGYALQSRPDAPGGWGWRWMLGLGAIPPALLLLGLCHMPESPRFLVASKREREARCVLASIYESEEAQTTLAMLQEDVREHARLPLLASLRGVFCPPRGAGRALVVAGLGVALCQQVRRGRGRIGAGVGGGGERERE